MKIPTCMAKQIWAQTPIALIYILNFWPAMLYENKILLLKPAAVYNMEVSIVN